MLALGFTGRPGWLEVSDSEPGLDARVWINVIKREGGRLAVGTLIVNGEPVDGATLRRIPVARIEALLNTTGVGEAALSPDVAREFAALHGPALQTYPNEFLLIEQALSTLLSGPVLGPPPNDAPTAERQPLRRPDGTDPGGFYRQVADAYRAVAGTTSRPAKLLAEEAGVPVPTVHRWIHEARRRELLPPARKGRAG